jgi:hypothetical protein
VQQLWDTVAFPCWYSNLFSTTKAQLNGNELSVRSGTNDLSFIIFTVTITELLMLLLDVTLDYLFSTCFLQVVSY